MIDKTRQDQLRQYHRDGGLLLPPSPKRNEQHAPRTEEEREYLNGMRDSAWMPLAGKFMTNAFKADEQAKAAKALAAKYADKLERDLGLEALRILKKFKTPAELIVVGLNDDGKSQNAIVEKLRALDVTPRTKLFVNQTIKCYNGLKLGKRTPDAMEKTRKAGKQYTEEAGKPIPESVETTDFVYPEEDRKSIVAAYNKATTEERREMLNGYPWLRKALDDGAKKRGE